MIRRPPRSTLSSSSAASDVYKRQPMNTVMFNLVCENGKLIPIIAPATIIFPSLQVTGFKSACGAGSGVGDWIVPERVFGLSLTPACFVHDFMWDNAEPTWEYFHASNSIFLSNLISLIQCQSVSEM